MVLFLIGNVLPCDVLLAPTHLESSGFMWLTMGAVVIHNSHNSILLLSAARFFWRLLAKNSQAKSTVCRLALNSKGEIPDSRDPDGFGDRPP